MFKKLNRHTAQEPVTHPVRILQFGKGNFLRGFIDWMVDIANEKQNFNTAIQIVQVNAQSTDNRFAEQDGLYHVVLNGIQGAKPFTETRLITCVAGVVNPFENYETYLRTGENPDLEFIISNTTEAGIEFRESDQNAHALPESFPGKLTALLYRRYQFFRGDPAKALTILPCELIENNGAVLRETIIKYIEHWNLGDGFRKWITDHTGFCNTLVDRIITGYPKDNIDAIWKATGFEDKLVVAGEPFHLWVIEPVAPGASATRLAERLPFKQAGLQVKFVDDLTPYRSGKVRILNGSHTAMVPVGYLRGLRTVRAVIDDSFTGDFVRKMIWEEILPTLDLPREESEKFATDTIERFQNPFIRHELMSIALNSVSKFQVRVLPSIMACIAQTGTLPKRLLYAFAALIIFYRGEWRGEAVPLNDTPEVIAFFRKAWENPEVSAVVNMVLGNSALWKADLTKIEGLAREVEQHMHEIAADS